VHELQHLRDARVALVLRGLPHLEAEAHVLGHGHVRKEGVALEHDAEAALVHRQVGDVAAVERHAAARHGDEAGDRLQGRRLAAARGAEQRDELAALDAQGHVDQRAEVAVVLRHALEIQK
jgi:hypothetical protein